MTPLPFKRWLRPVRERIRANAAADRKLLGAVVRLRQERGRVADWLRGLAEGLHGPAPEIRYVGGHIGETDAKLHWHYAGQPEKGFEVRLAAPHERSYHTAVPGITLEGLEPGTTYRGTLHSLDNPYAVAAFGFWTRPAGVTGYVAPVSAEAGESVELFLSSASSPVRITLLALTEPGRQIGMWEVDAPFQYAPYDASGQGCRWQPALRIGLPGDLEPGVYVFDLEASNRSRFSIPLIVRPAAPVELAVVLSTDTWNAYNNWGGNSFYDNYVGAPEPLWASEQRPSYLADPWSTGAYFLGAEAHLLRFLHRHNVACGVYSDVDLAAGRVAGCKTLVLVGHNEYWCADKLAAFDRLQAAGTNVVCFSGNTMYRRIIREPHRQAASRFALFQAHEVCSRLGTIYTAAGRETGAPYRVTAPGHWIYAGCNVDADTRFGEDPRTPVLGASGIETDKRTAHSPAGVEVVAVGQNANAGGAEWVVFEHAAGGWVVNSGSMTMVLHLDDPVMTTMVLNVLRKCGHLPAQGI